MSQQNNPRVTEPHHPFSHYLPLQLRFNDIDGLGHVNNTIYFQYFDLGKSHYFEAVAPDGIDWRRVNAVIVNVNCDFVAPAYLAEPLAVATEVTSIGQRSLRLEQRVVNTETGEVKAVCRSVMAGFDPHTAAGAPIDAAWAEAIEAYEGMKLRKEN